MDINDRLVAAKKKAGLSVTDMGHWFGAHRRTVDSWLRGVVPHAFRHNQILTKLDLLEKAIRVGVYFPIPMTVTQYDRKNYLMQVYNGVAGRVSKARASK